MLLVLVSLLVTRYFSDGVLHLDVTYWYLWPVVFDNPVHELCLVVISIFRSKMLVVRVANRDQYCRSNHF
jgi:hypothetical protein